MRKTILFFTCALFVTPSMAAELTLNDIPAILQKMRGCAEVKGIFSNNTVCRIERSELSVNVESNGDLLLMQRRKYGDTLFAHGSTVASLLQDYVSRINADRDNGKAIVDALAPYLPTQ